MKIYFLKINSFLKRPFLQDVFDHLTDFVDQRDDHQFCLCLYEGMDSYLKQGHWTVQKQRPVKTKKRPLRFHEDDLYGNSSDEELHKSKRRASGQLTLPPAVMRRCSGVSCGPTARSSEDNNDDEPLLGRGGET
jgi:hypothetical protein